MNLMKLHYALFDQSVFMEGDYWNWSSPEIHPLLSQFYSDAAVNHLPPKPNDLQDGDLWGGLVRLADWTVVYRYFNGGYDKQGRPGRFVLMTAWVRADDAQGSDLTPVFTNETFRHVAENAKTIPLPPPFALNEDWKAEKISASSFQEGDATFTRLDQAICAFSSITSRRKARFVVADIKIIKTEGEQRFVLSVVPEFIPESKPMPPHFTPRPRPPAPEYPGRAKGRTLENNPQTFWLWKWISLFLSVICILLLICVCLVSCIRDKNKEIARLKVQVEERTPTVKNENGKLEPGEPPLHDPEKKNPGESQNSPQKNENGQDNDAQQEQMVLSRSSQSSSGLKTLLGKGGDLIKKLRKSEKPTGNETGDVHTPTNHPPASEKPTGNKTGGVQ